MVIKNRYPNLRGCSLRSIKRFCSYHGIKKRMSVADGAVDINACTLVPSVFLRSRKTEFELLVSFSVYPRQRKTEFEIPFSFSVFLLHWKWNSSFCFRFWFSHDFGQQNSNSHFRFSSFVFVRYWRAKFDPRFSFFVSAFLSLSYFTSTGRMKALPVSNRQKGWKPGMMFWREKETRWLP